MKHTRISVVEALDESHHDGLTFSSGEIGIVEKVVGYKKIKFHSHENVGYGDVHLPEMEMQTRAMWFTLDESLVTSFGSPRVELMDALRGAANALHTVACVGLMIDPRDLGRHVREQPEGAESRGTDARLEPTVFLYDQVPGGVGLAVRLYEQRVGLFERAISLAEGCACAAGCPACVGPSVGMSNLNPASPTDTIRSSLRRGRAASVLRALSERASAGAAA